LHRTLLILRRSTAAAAVLLALCGDVMAQELEPGTYQNAPTTVNVAVAAYGFSRGNVLFDASLPVEGAKATVNVVALGYVRTLGILGRSAKFDAQLPLSWATFTGFVAGEFRTRSPRGMADPRVRLLINFIGAPALSPAEFAKYRQRTIVGVSLQAILPLGQYDPTRYINLGSNRWSFRPELGASHARGRLTLEATGGGWFFTHNADYVGSTTQTQTPLYFAKAGAIWTFRRGVWLAANYGRATGGETRVDGVKTNEPQRNDRLAYTFVAPFFGAGSLRLTYTSGLSTRLGADFDSLGIGYQYSWFRKPTTKPGA
jgi:outer membrane putative beta-barrel porin/alpha-amylase